VHYLEWVRHVWDSMRTWWPSLPELQQKRGIDAAEFQKRIVPPIPEEKPQERRDAEEAIFQALKTLQETHTLKVVSGTQKTGYFYVPSEMANFQQGLSFRAYMFSAPLTGDEATVLEAVIHQSEKSTEHYALLRELKVTKPDNTFALPPDSPLDEVDLQHILESLATKRLILTDKASFLGLHTYILPTLSGLLRIRAKEGH